MNSRPLARLTDRGQGLVEFALVFPIIVLVVFATIDVGRLVYAYTTITNAARSGARVAIIDQSAGVAAAAASSQATALDIPTSTVAVSYMTPDLSASCSPVERGCVAVVVVPYSWTALTPMIGNLLGPKTITAVTRMPVERIYSP